LQQWGKSPQSTILSPYFTVGLKVIKPRIRNYCDKYCTVITKGDGSLVFKVTAAALTVLDQAIAQEQTNELEKLYVRLSMGIG